MKILLVNKFHYLKGGSETYYFGLGELLKKHGCEVIYFSMKDRKNFSCDQEKYFVENVDFNAPMGKIRLAKTAVKMLYSFEARSKFEKLLMKEKPDLIHLNIFQSQLTASIVDVAYRYGIPIVYTAHDLKSICPNYQMLNHGKVCEKCIGRNYWNCFHAACMKDSKEKSLLASMEANIYKWKKTYKKINLIITPSLFYKKQIEKAAITKCPVVHMANFLPEDTKYSLSKKKGNYFLYFGRLSREKGILTLIKSYKKSGVKHPLYIVGTGPIENQVKELIDRLHIGNRVKMLGFKTGNELRTLVEESLCVCLPSEWYENGPYSVMEAMAVGKPAIVSNIGGLPEMIEDGINGYVREVGDIDGFLDAIVQMEKLTEAEYQSMSKKNMEKAMKNFDSERYLSQLLSCYHAVLKQYSIVV